MNWNRSALRVLTLALFLLPGFLSADQVFLLPIEELAANAQLIVQATVQSKSIQRDPEGRIYTKVDLQVAEVWKGSLATNHFTAVHGGGILGEQQTVVSGQVEYEIGEEVVAFLVINQRGEGVSIGLSQGKFHVWKDTATGEKLANNLFHGSAVTSAPGAGANAVTGPGVARDRLKVSELKQRVLGAGR